MSLTLGRRKQRDIELRILSESAVTENDKRTWRKVVLFLGIILTAAGALTIYISRGVLPVAPEQLFDVPLDTTGKDTVVNLLASNGKEYVIHANTVLRRGEAAEGKYGICEYEPAKSDRFCAQLKNVSWSLAVIDTAGGKPDIWTMVPDGYVVQDRNLWTTLGYFSTKQSHGYKITVRFIGRERPRRPMHLLAIETQPGIGIGVLAPLAIYTMLILGGAIAAIIGAVLILIARPWTLQWRAKD
jgi:hypothetical protein